MSRDKPNGCGPHWLPKRLKDGYFHSECNVHDIDYLEGEDQEKADKEFYDRMLKRIANDHNLTPWGRQLRYAQAWFYYNVVRTFGHTSHKDGWDL